MPTAVPQADARRLLASGAWVTAAGYADLLGDALLAEKALACYARLVRAGTAPLGTRAEQLRTGRVRLAQEALQRLVQRGECEATGAGPARQFRMTGSKKETAVFPTRPKPRRETVPLDVLLDGLDERLQLRDLPAGVLFDDATARAYAERMREGDAFEPTEVVREQRKGKQPAYWTFSGFTRTGAYALCEVNSVECLVYDGTFEDALFYALSQNRRHGQPTGKGDKTKAVHALMNVPALMTRVREAARNGGGLAKAMAAACGVSASLVERIVKDSGQRIQNYRIVAVEPDPEPAPEKSDAGETDSHSGNPSPAARTDAPAAVAPAADPPRSAVNGSPEYDLAKDQLTRIGTQLRAVGRDVEALLRGRAGDLLRSRAKLEGVAFQVTERKVEKHMPHEVVTERYETWPALATMQAVFAQVAAQIADLEAQKGGAR